MQVLIIVLYLRLGFRVRVVVRVRIGCKRVLNYELGLGLERQSVNQNLTEMYEIIHNVTHDCVLDGG
jgi:hypothetical protein